METCKKCDEFIYGLLPHKCPPLWHAIDCQGNYDWEHPYTVYSDTDEEAAEKMGANMNQDQKPCEWVITIRPAEGGEESSFRVYPEIELHHYAVGIPKQSAERGEGTE